MQYFQGFDSAGGFDLVNSHVTPPFDNSINSSGSESLLFLSLIISIIISDVELNLLTCDSLISVTDYQHNNQWRTARQTGATEFDPSHGKPLCIDFKCLSRRTLAVGGQQVFDVVRAISSRAVPGHYTRKNFSTAIHTNLNFHPVDSHRSQPVGCFIECAFYACTFGSCGKRFKRTDHLRGHMKRCRFSKPTGVTKFANEASIDKVLK